MLSFAPLPQKIAGVIFDCDGVIVDSRKPNAAYYNKVLEAFGLAPLTKEQEAFTFMSTVEAAFKFIIPEHLQPQLLDVIKKNVSYERDIMPLVELQKGFYDFVMWLKNNNVRRAVHTNRAEGMQLVVNKFNFLEEFSPIMTAAQVKGKPDPEGVFAILSAWNVPAQEVLFVGDSSSDQMAAHAAGVPFVAYDNSNLESTINVNSYEELQNVIAKLV